MLTESALARTFSPPAYTDPCECVEEYRHVMEWASHHPESGSSAAASALNLPRGRIRPWLTGGKPDAVHAIETADDLEWLDAAPATDPGRSLLLLTAGVLSGGSIDAARYVPHFTVDDSRSLAGGRVRRCLTAVGCGVRKNTRGAGRADELVPQAHGALLGRALLALGVPAGSKAAAGDLSLPGALDTAPLSVRAAWAELYLLNRGVGRTESDILQVQEHGRPMSYRRALAGFFEAVGGGEVSLAGDDALTLSAATSRALGFGREGPYRRDDDGD